MFFLFSVNQRARANTRKGRFHTTRSKRKSKLFSFLDFRRFKVGTEINSHSNDASLDKNDLTNFAQSVSYKNLGSSKTNMITHLITNTNPEISTNIITLSVSPGSRKNRISSSDCLLLQSYEAESLSSLPYVINKNILLHSGEVLEDVV